MVTHLLRSPGRPKRASKPKPDTVPELGWSSDSDSISVPVITSAQNQTVKRFRSLGRPQTGSTERVVILEGLRAVKDALDAGFAPEFVLVRDDFDLARITSLPAQTDLRVLTAKVFDTLAETQHPQGVLAAVPLPLLEPETSSPRLSLIADQIRDPGNLGTMLRSAVAAGATSVSITRGSVHPDNRKAVRAGMGAHFRIPINVFSEFGSLTSFLADHEQVVVCDASGDRDYDQINYEVPTAILIGGEAEGVDPAVLRFATTVVRIPMEGGVESLNAGVAASIVLFEAQRQRRLSQRALTEIPEKH